MVDPQNYRGIASLPAKVPDSVRTSPSESIGDAYILLYVFVRHSVIPLAIDLCNRWSMKQALWPC